MSKYKSEFLCLLIVIAYICSLTPKEFNSYGARRGNDDIMARGTFANIRLVNKLVSKSGPRTLHIPSGEEVCTVLAFSVPLHDFDAI